MDILITRVWLEGRKAHIAIEGNRICSITFGEEPFYPEAQVIDGHNMAVIPGFVNGHTHAAMTLLRGYADDMPLDEWLKTKIWPREARLTPEMIYQGNRLACLEMIKSGTTSFVDMYFQRKEGVRAAEEMGLRSHQPYLLMDFHNPERALAMQREAEEAYYDSLGESPSGLTQFALAAHSVYVVSAASLQWIAKFSESRQLPVHIHLSETESEVADAMKNFGKSPVRYLADLGFLSPRVIASHALWLSSEDIDILAEHDVKVIHNPASNLKLASGYRFLYNELRDKGVCVGLGTDGCSSSNNLDMMEAMKLATLLQKAWRSDSSALPAAEVFALATANGGAIMNRPLGIIKEGALADLVLVRLDQPAFTPNFHFVSNLVYSGNSSSVDSVICNGKILMQNRIVPGEEAILAEARETAFRLVADDPE
ncbi:MAG: amidohydrolase [Bacteroidales bacterium]